MKTAALVLLAATLATGCASRPVKPEAVVVIKPAPRVPPATAMQACPELEALDDASFGAVVRKLGDVASLYRLCEQRRRELQEFIQSELPAPSAKD